jgi:lipid-A-disaccharide synthase-like uncharacterized protein
MDQDGFLIALGLLALAFLASGLWTGRFELQFLRATRKNQPILYWFLAILIALVAFESLRRAWLFGCVDCDLT